MLGTVMSRQHRSKVVVFLPTFPPLCVYSVTVATVRPLRLHHLRGAAAGLLRVHLLQGPGDQGPHLRGDRLQLPPVDVRRGAREVRAGGIQQRYVRLTDHWH